MSYRNLSPQVMFQQMALQHVPQYHFDPAKDEFASWKQGCLSEVLATLGDSPPVVDSDPVLMASWEHDGLLKERWLLNVAPHIAATLLVNRPADLAEQETRPALLCCHGHGAFGKEPVMGNDSSPELKQVIQQHNYSYGHTMAKDGFVTFAIDWIGFGERNDNAKPNFHNTDRGRDWCNLYYLHATMLGMTSLSINLAHGWAATEFVTTLPYVDPTRLGVMGLSGGGTMALWMALCHERFRAIEIICYSDLWPYFGFRDINYCGMQVAPGLFKLVDLPDLQGLLAPRPLLVDIGANDTCFRVDTAMVCFHQVETIYKAAGARDRLELDLHPGEHGWGGNRSVDFFHRHLASDSPDDASA